MHEFEGYEKEAAEVADQKRFCITKRQQRALYLLVLISVLVVVGVITFNLIDYQSSDEPLPPGPHEWLCGETVFPLLIDGDSVKLYSKIFTPSEIELLKSKNSDDSKSTY